MAGGVRRLELRAWRGRSGTRLEWDAATSLALGRAPPGEVAIEDLQPIGTRHGAGVGLVVEHHHLAIAFGELGPRRRARAVDGGPSRLSTVAVDDRLDSAPSANLRFSSAVAEFGMLLRDSEHRGLASWEQVLDLARGAVGDDPQGHRTEFLVLARSAQQLATVQQVAISRQLPPGGFLAASSPPTLHPA